MKKVMLACLAAMVFMCGCVGARYTDRTYCQVNGKAVLMHETILNYSALNVKTQTKGVKLKLPNNVELLVDERQQIPDPNSAIAEGQAIGNVLSGGTSGVIQNVVEP
jgi:hypothetical protein